MVLQQGFAVRLLMEHSTDAAKVRAAIMEVLSHERYAAAAQALSRQLRVRARTPTEEAVGGTHKVLLNHGARQVISPVTAVYVWSREVVHRLRLVKRGGS